MTKPIRRKLIEVALPLDAINRESARENYIYRGNPSSIHKWWAQRPLAAARAVLFAQMVDDPSARPDVFPTLRQQDAERKRLFTLIERLVVWENIGDEKLLQEAHAEILKSTNGNPPPVLDPFAGGGSIPLEAQRLGLEAHASDLNPVAVLINKALIEIPPKFAGHQPIHPSVDRTVKHWPRATGLAEDVRRYGAWMRDEAASRIGHLYPKVVLSDGREADAIAWIWARTVTCPNPACRIAMPLVRSFWLSKKKERLTWAVPVVEDGQVRFDIVTGKGGPSIEGTVGRQGATCVSCQTPVDLKYIRAEGKSRGLGAVLMAVVAEETRKRAYFGADAVHLAAAVVERPDDAPEAPLPVNPRDFKTPNYGMSTFADLFTNRQLVALTTFSDLVGETHDRVVADALTAGLDSIAAQSYASAIALYLSFVLSKAADYNCSGAVWYAKEDRPKNLFARHAIPMVWDFPEINPLGTMGGTWEGSIEVVTRAMDGLVTWGGKGVVSQGNAADVRAPVGSVVSTDPPYYDNIGYADLSDFFYVWLRRSLGSIFADVTGTMLTPKAEELVATPYRFGGSKKKAEEHFERGFVRTFTRIREQHSPDIPITVFYAFKQAESDASGTASTGWETMLNGLMEAGLMVTATWPMRTERTGRSIGIGTNSLASSIVLACRPRPVSADATTRRGLITALKAELPSALRHLQQGSVAPVDLAQAAIGPGMAVFTRYSRVVEADGSGMNIRTALNLINQVLDETLSEQEGDFDSDTRFCVRWFTQFGWNKEFSGTADTLSRATNTSTDGLQRGGVFRAVAGEAWLIAPEDLPDDWNPLTDDRTCVWETAMHIARVLTDHGVDAAADLMAGAAQRVDLDAVKELAYRLYTICERKGWTQTAILFNALGTSWGELESASHSVAGVPAQGAFTFDANN